MTAVDVSFVVIINLQEQAMSKRLAAFGFLFLVCAQSPAQADMTFRLVSQSSGKCLRLVAADQNDGGGLTMRDCKNFPDYFVSGTVSTTQLMFQLNSSRFVCIFSTEKPFIDPTGQHAPVQTRNCGNVVGSVWNIRGANDQGFRQIEKLSGIDSTNFCMRENPQTSRIELEVCQGVPHQHWKLETVTFPSDQ